jgi:hypothetical protein
MRRQSRAGEAPRSPLAPSPIGATIAVTLSDVAGALRAGWCLTVRLMPRRVAFTASEAVGEGWPAKVCA